MNYNLTSFELYSNNSPPARACRRLFFNYTNASIAETGTFQIEHMFGLGSCVLLKIAEKFFFLTAKHVFTANNIDLNNLQNESPFWITAKARVWEPDLRFFLFPKFAWMIGDNIKQHKWKYVDFSDVLLVELFPPLIEPDCFIEIDENGSGILKEEQYFQGQILSLNGFPESNNKFSYDDVPNGYTHKALISRKTMPAVNIQSDDGWLANTDISSTPTTNHKGVNGMSGGCICNMDFLGSRIKFVGLITSAYENIVRYIPAHALLTNIINYQQSPRIILDPITQIYE